MRRFSFLFVAVLLGLYLAANLPGHEVVEAVPPRDGQPHTDTFIIPGYGDLQQYNPVTIKAKATSSLTYRYTQGAGCVVGTIKTDVAAVAMDMLVNWRLLVVETTSLDADFIIQINCGMVQVSNCGATNIFCVMGRPYAGPYDRPNVSISDIINTYPPVSRRSILCHEICGHTILTWNEQYCIQNDTALVCRGLTLFSPAPNWVDIMNTGENSRHDLGPVENERADRTFKPILTVNCLVGPANEWGGVWDECKQWWDGPNGWNFSPSRNEWVDDAGISEWCCQQPYGGIYNRRLDAWSWTRTDTWQWKPETGWRCVTGCP